MPWRVARKRQGPDPTTTRTFLPVLSDDKLRAHPLTCRHLNPGATAPGREGWIDKVERPRPVPTDRLLSIVYRAPPVFDD